MSKNKQHKRFIILTSNNLLTLAGCYWYAQTGRSFMLIGEQRNNKNIRPWYCND